MTAILRVPGVMFQQRREEQSCIVQTESATVDVCQPAQEDRRRPPSVISGAISGAGSGLGGGCTGFTVGDPPVEDVPDAETDFDYYPEVDDQPDEGVIEVDADADTVTDEVPPPDDGDAEVNEDGDVDEDGDTIPDGEDGEVEEDGETADPCANSPVISPTTSPVDGAPDIILTPTLDWDVSDLDAGDTLTYRVRLWRTADPSTILADETVGDSQYAIPAGILANNENYSWQIDAWDSCAPTANLISSPVWTFTTEPACAPYSFTDTDFTTGTLGGGAVANAGSLRLQEDYSAYTGRYEGDVLPEAVGWSRTGTFASVPSSDGDILSASTLGTDALGYYETSASLNNATGWVVEARVSINDQDGTTPPTDAGFTIRVADGRRVLEFRIIRGATVTEDGQVCEPFNTTWCRPVTPGFHSYRIVGQGDDFRLYIDGVLAIDGTGLSGSGAGGANHIRIGDQMTIPDSSVNVDYVRWYNLDDQLPYVASGSYVSAPEDTGVAGYGFSGSTINWTPASAPGTVSAAVRAGDTPDLSLTPWSAEMTDNPAALPTVNGQYLQWRITLTAPSATVTPVVDEVAGGRICP